MKEILLNYWGHQAFRPLQEEIIASVVSGKDTLALLPTGGGKSITFQVPALAKEGICIVVTPLIALMKDQVENLKERGVKAVAIYSGMSKHEIEITLDNCVFGDIKFLYVSPERLTTDLFINKLQQFNVNLLAIDEAHCISQWGYDFRPSYLKIAQVREYLPNVPILALTATATVEVVKDIQAQLKFRKENVLRKSFERKNLIYLVREVDDKLQYLLKIATTTQGTGIVYVRSRLRTKEIALFLQQNNISADYYHAGLEHTVRSAKQADWKAGKTRIIVSTNAFGMGIDKADVRFVVHIDVPESLEAYFQEAGRAGRDEKLAYCVLLTSQGDDKDLEKNISTSFPERKVIKQIYHALGNYYQIPIGGGKDRVLDFSIYDFSKRYNLHAATVFSCLKILQNESYIELTDEIFTSSKVNILVNQSDLYKFQVANERYDSFIKLLLRTYSGIFTDYIAINEDQLARAAKTSVEVVKQYLQKLSTSKILDYVPQKKTPQIIFTEERLEEKSLRLSPEHYDTLKERHINRINAVIQYFTTQKCRSLMLLEYFGETDTHPCGECDVCKSKTDLNLTKFEVDSITSNVLDCLSKQSYSLEDIVNQIVSSTNIIESKTIKVIRWLIENEKVNYIADENRILLK